MNPAEAVDFRRKDHSGSMEIFFGRIRLRAGINVLN
jgi:hypothetical protein